MNKTILSIALVTAMTGCAATPPAGNRHLGCEAAYLRIKAEGPKIERDLRECLHEGFNLRNPKCLDNRRFAAFTGDTHMVRSCVDAKYLRPSLEDVAHMVVNLQNIAVLAEKLGDMAAAQGL